MKKIVFLGCENSHSKQFLSYIKENKKYDDIKVIGCHSDDEKAKNDLAGQFGVKALDNFYDAVDKVDGVIVTARHGDFHLKFVKPYLKNGITAYIDKPVTISEEDAIELVKIAKENNVKLVGQSSLILDDFIIELKNLKKEKGCIGGFVRAPVSMDNPYGGFYFYSEHLVDMVLAVFGWYPNSVVAKDYSDHISVVFKYDNFDVNGIFGKDNYVYCAGLYHKEGSRFSNIPVTGGEKCFADHFDEFYNTMSSKENVTDYAQFISPVFVLNAIFRSLTSNKEEKVRRFDI